MLSRDSSTRAAILSRSARFLGAREFFVVAIFFMMLVSSLSLGALMLLGLPRLMRCENQLRVDATVTVQLGEEASTGEMSYMFEPRELRRVEET